MTLPVPIAPAKAIRADVSVEIPFRRLHGAGNDYVFVHRRDLDDVDGGRAAVALADRHRGVGGDGLISIEVSATRGATDPPPRIRMRMWNADGSESGMCGNGVRGAVRFAVEEGLIDADLVAGPSGVVVEIGERRVRCRLAETGRVFRVSVEMGRASFDGSAIPFHPTRSLDGASSPRLRTAAEFDALGAAIDPPRSLVGWSVASMGNPHLVLVVSDPAALDGCPLATVGAALERAPAFPERTNVHLARVEGRGRFRLRTWERGSGITLACGSGACAAFAILRRGGLLKGPAAAVLDGGTLDLASCAEGGIEMTGPSESCCRGRADLTALLAAVGRRSEIPATPCEIDLPCEETAP